MCNFFFCHYVFKKPSAAEASESIYMRERVKLKQAENDLYIFKKSLENTLKLITVGELRSSAKNAFLTLLVVCSQSFLKFDLVT